jgi:Thiol:disulfide interchange protein DsbD, N-terminal
MLKQFLALTGIFALGAMVAQAQLVSPNAQSRPIVKTEAVQYLFPEQVSVAAGKASPVALHFRVAQGLHINSHTPKDSFLIPTTFSIPEGGGVKLDTANYPAGTIISLAFDPKTTLSVYTGEFTIETRVVAAAGNHLMRGKLHYQACDQNQCLPPKTIDVPIDVIGK